MFRARSTTAIVVIALVGAFAAACANNGDDPSSASTSDLSSPTFHKNDVLDDATLTDASALDAAQIQQFLEKTPFRDFLFVRTTSPLATYRDGGKLASEILAATAQTYAINPIELLVALEAEQSLISATDLDETAASLAFRCGCPDGDECIANPNDYTGFQKQADCYGAALRASLDAQKVGATTKTGWKRGLSRLTDDEPQRILVTPANMATAALYTYTPFVGKGGGGDAALGGVSKHWELFTRFEKALSYPGPPDAGSDASASDAALDAATDAAVSDGASANDAASSDSGSTKGTGASCAMGGTACSSGLVCDTTATPQRCVECTPAHASACSAAGTGAACVDHVCGCTSDADCSDGRTCELSAHVCKGAAANGTSPATPTAEPPSGHGTNDRATPAKPEPEFAPLNPPPAGGGVGCHASPSRPGGAGGAGGALALAGVALALAWRSRRRPALTARNQKKNEA